ncbi:GroES-like protein [Lojkania enalia]|uniref:GroES-like protein n=1 Tax=Lojkania enalia TaxID=147567 RepID=A0A9P4K351_9PLEO|nr:GroES-like protein [Didymosphaeria enalia]
MPELPSYDGKTMRAVFWKGHPYSVSVQSVPQPTILHEEDAIVIITASAICGSDLHIYRGLLGSEQPPWSLGHEAIGVVTAVGEATENVKVGDRVLVPDIPDDGYINMGVPAFEDSRLFGVGRDFGGLGGLQAQYARVPFADNTLLKLPYYEDKDKDLDYLFIGDIWSTGWICLDQSGFQPGETVAVFGAGPVGLLCAYSALLRGASKVYIVDYVQQRLDKAREIGAIPINFAKGNAATQIMQLEPQGVARSCDCCGYECVNEELQPQQNAIINDMVRVTALNGGIGVVGVYSGQAPAPGRPLAGTIPPTLEFPIAEAWLKNLSIGMGLANPKPLAPRLMALVETGRAKPRFVVSKVIGIEEAEEAYRAFERKEEIKVVIRFAE